MSKILKVARREYVESVKSKTFIISVFMAPLIVVAIIFFSSRIAQTKSGSRPPLKIAITDLTGRLADEIKASFDTHNKSSDNRQIIVTQTVADANSFDEQSSVQKNRLREGKIDSYVVIDSNIVSGDGKISHYTYKTKASNVDSLWIIEKLCRDAVIEYRYKIRNVDKELIDKLLKVPTQQIEIGQEQGQEKVKGKGEMITSMMVPFIFMLLMYLGIFINAQHMLTSVIEEKSSRVIELLLSAVNSFQLMAGKILGLAGIGLTVIALWVFAAYSAAQWRGLPIDITGWLFLYFVVYYILGFILLSAMVAGIGSICNTLKDAQNLMGPITIIYMLPIMSWFKLVQNPQGTYATALSYVPPLTPLVMMLRLSASSDVTIIEILATFVVLVVSVILVIWLSAKVFRTGILMYGKRPRLREVFRWLRQS